MSNSQIALENKFKYLLEKFGYVAIAVTQGKADLPEIYLREIDNLLNSIDDRLSKTSDKDKKSELTDLHNVGAKLRVIASQLFSADLLPSLPLSKISPKKGSPINLPLEIPQPSPRFEQI